MAERHPPAHTTPKASAHAGLRIRVWAALIDSALFLIVVFPILGWLLPTARGPSVHPGDLISPDGHINPDTPSALGLLWPTPLHTLVYWILPAIVIVRFWRTRDGTPGKMAIHARIVDAPTGEAPTTRQLILRYIGYHAATLPFDLGLAWLGIDGRKQGWHDEIARTVVIRTAHRRAAATNTTTHAGHEHKHWNDDP
ncbi:RDD family protein [Salinisphaera sp. Q1T1-3]|uniref:RDD family protein n=1 Tax=Salinisphaera sp. Q1T1-3 TaxID=2321229 RepID=UPI000E74118E|nr:RDD family protein [Salinisphaera sp. Q1T1-3]RJS94297.1 RDD family protein [Salinisphaera sp. Q1T1-3]